MDERLVQRNAVGLKIVLGGQGKLARQGAVGEGQGDMLAQDPEIATEGCRGQVVKQVLVNAQPIRAIDAKADAIWSGS
jgi:hypothetical protein